MFDSFPSPWTLLKLGARLLLGAPLGKISDDWLSLNNTLDGRLQHGVPFAHPCFGGSSTNDLARCAEIQEKNEDHCK
jgi:hypothetical protein